ncbi:MAG: hypothetical protein C4K60_13795 [Ideonella sp. MAG2]|nr:MAG: hypothetical protein C4K60_13795 [Ideonella sp. MAG2]
MPTFIVGFARSGTTLCQRLVAEHFALATVPETHFFECLPEHLPEGERLSRRQAQGLERILKLFPAARFIAMVRSPFTALASRRELAQPGRGWGEGWRPIDDYARDWAWTQQHIWQFAQAHPNALLQVRLEDLSRDADAELERIGRFLRRAPRRGRRLGQGRLLMPFETWKRGALGEADPAVAQRLGRSGLSPFERWRLSRLLAPQLAALGYSEDCPAPPMDALHQELLATVDWFRPALPSVPLEQASPLMASPTP